MLSVQWFTITPDGELDFSVDLTVWLGTDTISTAEWTLPSPLQKTGESNTSTSATVFATGASYGSDYLVKVYVVTSAGRKESFHILLTGARL